MNSYLGLSFKPNVYVKEPRRNPPLRSARTVCWSLVYSFYRILVFLWRRSDLPQSIYTMRKRVFFFFFFFFFNTAEQLWMVICRAIALPRRSICSEFVQNLFGVPAHNGLFFNPLNVRFDLTDGVPLLIQRQPAKRPDSFVFLMWESFEFVCCSNFFLFKVQTFYFSRFLWAGLE